MSKIFIISTYLSIIAHVVRVGVGIILSVSLLTGGAGSRSLAVLSIRVARSWLSLVHLTCDTCNRYCELHITTKVHFSAQETHKKMWQTFGHPGLRTTPSFLREQSIYPKFGTTLDKKRPSCVANEIGDQNALTILRNWFKKDLFSSN